MRPMKVFAIVTPVADAPTTAIVRGANSRSKRFAASCWRKPRTARFPCAAIALDSPEAATLLALCKKTAGNPFALDAWMAELVPAASGESSAVTP
jgi:hypothetical protein